MVKLCLSFNETDTFLWNYSKKICRQTILVSSLNKTKIKIVLATLR